MADQSDLTSRTASAHDSAEAVAAYDKGLGLWPIEAHLVARFFPKPPATVLDLGCGNGRTTVPLREMGYDVVGLDLCQPLVHVAHARRPEVVYTVADARGLPFKAGHFDTVIFSWNGLDYMYPVESRRRTLQGIWRVLKPGGKLLFSSHNALGCAVRLTKPVGLALMALRFLFDQIPPTRDTLRWYCMWRDAALGEPVFFSGPPHVNVRILKSEGWVVRAVCSPDPPFGPARTFRDVHVHYLCERPAEA